MKTAKLSVQSPSGRERVATDWSAFAILTHREIYEKGDCIVLETSSSDTFWEIRLDDAMPAAVVYLAGTELRFPIPFDEQKTVYSPKSFVGSMHMLSARPAEACQIKQRRNLAFNPYDHSASLNCFPHASANVETRGEAVFAARNTIDGCFANCSHGPYPFQSWGINRDPNAALKIDLGQNHRVDEIRLTLRADFPHDNYWVQARLSFSDGSHEIIALSKTEQPQSFPFPERHISWVVLDQLIASEEESPFPALTQIEIWGTP